ncbi:creatinase domain protein [Streptococcus constellatus subsp. pharyngis SK1060 = CCUG 46377]|uniref:Creatinase domain protein n=1 Tax=Streptococcus constellatus subsp. pharyngis SK1060 = CCUG 46377 TaxID=1035184 RepID=F9P8W1_STRCV|nr:creatinase domain protein [Streptococcus constellatus subsp. pharyngis SK1060 = CCUG 46377]
MTKINQIISYLETEKADVAVVSDPVTINYLTGFYSDPHERQMFLLFSQIMNRCSLFLLLR